MFLSEKERDETVWACRFCMMCHCADRVGQVVRRESYTPRGRGAIIFALDEGLLDYDEGVADIMYTTLNDRMLQHWCMGNYDHEELVIDTRARLFEKGLAPEEVIAYVKNLRKKPVQGGDPVKILSDAGVTLDSDSDTLLFCGSAARNSQQATLIAAGKLFNQGGKSFKVLADEPSSGWALYQLGDFEGTKQLSTLLAEKIRNSKVSTVVALDADSYRMLMGRTTRFGGDIKGIKILHVNAVMAGWLKDNQISVAEKIPDVATYHDPCVLARFFEDVESPRYILSQILDDDLKEMATNKKLANCCGAGGMLAVHRTDVSEDVAVMRIDEAKETGASLLVSGCPRCDETFKGAMAARDIEDIRVVNLVELVADAAGLT
ncbi:MAG: (Fe-S)-binding protein [Deltaproteobacteria bacterium]|nr:(Fe-S)-binding protein [Deltaproteobacteria bacterium]